MPPSAAKNWVLFHTADERLYKYWGRRMTVREREPVELFRSKKKDEEPDAIRWGIELKSCHVIVGEVVVFNIQNDRMGELGYRLAYCMHGKGYCSEALSRIVKFCFEETQLQRLELKAMVENIASNKVAQKCGFVCEGTVRQGKFVNVYADFNSYGMIRSDYIKLKVNQKKALQSV